MARHRFVVNVPNPTAQSASVSLRLEPARRKDFSWLPCEFPKAGLEVVHAGLSLDPCAEERKVSLNLRLKPFTSVDIHVVVNTTPSKKQGIAGFHVVDRRRGKDIGGVLLVCTDPPFVEPVSRTISPPHPCAAILARDLYLIQPGDDPSKLPTAKPVQPNDSFELVAQIANPTCRPLKNAQVYLEHLGISTVGFTPGTWNIGTLAKGNVFYATWPVRVTEWQFGTCEASIVVASQGTDPVRLRGKFSLAFREE